MTAIDKSINRNWKKERKRLAQATRLARKELALIEKALKQYNLHKAAQKAYEENRSFYARRYTLEELQESAREMTMEDKQEWAEKFFSNI